MVAASLYNSRLFLLVCCRWQILDGEDVGVEGVVAGVVVVTLLPPGISVGTSFVVAG